MKAKALPYPSHTTLHQLLEYDPETGVLTWKPRFSSEFGKARDCSHWNATYAGKEAFTKLSSKGDRLGVIYTRTYLAAHIIYIMVYKIGAKQVKFLNGNRSDVRLANLTAVHGLRETAAELVSEVPGIFWDVKTGYWVSTFFDGTKVQTIGRFSLKESAIRAQSLRKAA